MSTIAWPSFPFLELTVKRTRLDRRNIETTLGGHEFITIEQTVPRFRYDLSYRSLRSNVNMPLPWGGYTETGLLDYLANRSILGLDQITFVDPIDGVTRNVRFEKDDLGWVQDGFPTWWACSFALISQL